jgi:hypothetical protein
MAEKREGTEGGGGGEKLKKEIRLDFCIRLIKKKYFKTFITSNNRSANRLQQQQKCHRQQPSTSRPRATSEKGARGSRTSATSETLGTADTTATTEIASISRDNKHSQHANSSGNAGVSREVRSRGCKLHDINDASYSKNVRNSIAKMSYCKTMSNIHQ